MKRENLLNILVSTLLVFGMAVGSVGALMTAFGLPLAHGDWLIWGGLAFSALCAVLFQWKHGGLLLLCLLALGGGYLWHRGELAEQCLYLLSRLTEVYDRAYGWGVFPAGGEFVDLPMLVVGIGVIVTVSRALCRGTGAALPVLTVVLFFAPCIVVTDTVPALPCLFLLLVGLGVLVLTAGVRRESIFRGDRLTAMLLLPLLLAAGALFLLNPQETYVNQSKELQQAVIDWTAELPSLVENSAAGISGKADTSQQVNLSSLGRRIERRNTVMEVTAQTDGILYLRGRDYDSYDGFGWVSTRNRTEEFYCPGGAEDTVTIRTRNVETLLYLPYYPSEETRLVGGTASNTDGLKEYTFSRSTLPDAVAWEDDGQIVAGVGSAEDPDFQRYLTLPIEAEAGLRAVVNGLDLVGSSGVKAEAIASYVRNSAEYDLNPSRMPEDTTDFACWFLKEGEQGYCVHFATAATVLLRAAGIPARYVTGYMVTAKAGETVKVTGENAHAWAEYYDPDRKGWVVLEATPADEGEEAETSAGTEATEASETRPPESQTRPTEQEPASSEAPTAPTVPAERKPVDLTCLGNLAKWLLALAVLAAVLEAQRQLRLRLRRRSRGTPNARALARWRETALLAKLAGEDPPRELHRLAQKAKFSQHTLTREELSQFDGYLRTARQELKAKPWYVRLAHQYVFAAY